MTSLGGNSQLLLVMWSVEDREAKGRFTTVVKGEGGRNRKEANAAAERRSIMGRGSVVMQERKSEAGRITGGETTGES
jgi:hypothetical protein